MQGPHGNTVRRKFMIFFALSVAAFIALCLFTSQFWICDSTEGACATNRTLIYLVTPTYRRPTQVADLTRMSQTLMHVRNKIHWIVVEDSTKYSTQVRGILMRSGVPFTHLLGPTPEDMKNPDKGRGVAPRLRALSWLQENAILPSVLYFADDDNTYDLRLFNEIQNTKKVSVFPVGLLCEMSVGTVILENGAIIGFHDSWTGGREFPLDFAGFAVNMALIKNSTTVDIPYKTSWLENGFLKSLGISVNDLEPQASNCTEVFVWHTQTRKGHFPNPKLVSPNIPFNETNLKQLYQNVLGQN